MVINRLPFTDMLSSIEHNVDYLAKFFVSNTANDQNYTRPDETNWDHQYPLKVDAEAQKIEK